MTRQSGGLIGGLLPFIVVLLLPTPEGMSPMAQRAAAVTVLMAVWWMTEAIPIAATAFVPAALFPLLGILDAKATAANYGHNYVLMFLAGFFIARAFEVHQLHRRIALSLIHRIGTSRRRIVLSFMLAIAYSASIGGTGSLLGTPPNMVFVGMVKTMYPQAPDVTFIDWMEIGTPFVMCMLPVTWLFLTRSFRVTGSFSGSREVITSELELLGPMQPGERRVLCIFLLTGLGWIFRDIWAASLGVEHLVHDATVAVAAALALFVLPSGNKGERLLDWQQAQTVPWGVAMIVGGGYAIAKGFATTGLATWLGDALAPIAALPLPVIVLLVVLFMTFITEINSNTATASIFLPVLATMATAGHTHPFLLMIPATFACSCAFMLPSGTGPNAVIFGSGQVTIPQMSRAGLRMNFISVVMLSVIMVLFAIPLLDISGTPPAWATLP
ncbi:MAG: anion transporter [Gemmatimonadaceae bacterium]|nr:anion transporter [Gemmatimonadaceae bacterium]